MWGQRYPRAARAVGAAGLSGHKAWRLPGVEQLQLGALLPLQLAVDLTMSSRLLLQCLLCRGLLILHHLLQLMHPEVGTNNSSQGKLSYTLTLFKEAWTPPKPLIYRCDVGHVLG